MQEALHFRTSLLQAQCCGFTAELTAQGETEVYSCTLGCEADEQGLVTVTVIEPEEIAGVTAVVGREGAEVSYDGLRLSFGQLGGATTPMGAPGLLYAAWTGGYIAASGSEDGLTLTRYLLGTGSSERQVDTWFDAGGTPVACDVSENGVVVLSCRLRDWRLGTAETAAVTDEAAPEQMPPEPEPDPS